MISKELIAEIIGRLYVKNRRNEQTTIVDNKPHLIYSNSSLRRTGRLPVLPRLEVVGGKEHKPVRTNRGRKKRATRSPDRRAGDSKSR